MKILAHKLVQDDGTPIPFVRSPDQSGEVQHDFLVMHYMAGRSAESSVNWLTNPDSRASAHVVIGRDGSITQLVAFNRRAFHVGRSAWLGFDGLNSFSLGPRTGAPTTRPSPPSTSEPVPGRSSTAFRKARCRRPRHCESWQSRGVGASSTTPTGF